MTDFRALCIELTDCLEKADWPLRYRYVFRQWVDIARAALADGPAVPNGREPASVTGQPSDEAWDALVERAWDKYQTVGYQGERFMYDRDFGNALEFVRQGLTRWGNPAPQPPAEEEVGELVRWLRSRAGIPASPDFPAVAAMLTRAADLLEQRHPAPVPVSERPWEREGWCDKRGMCWWLHVGEDGVGDWLQRAPYPSVTSYAFFRMTHCLPAHALPLPGQEVGE